MRRQVDRSEAATIALSEAARRLGVSLGSARAAAKAGELPAIPWRRSYRVLKSDFEAMIAPRNPRNVGPIVSTRK